MSCSLLAQCGDIELQRAVVRVVEEAIRDIAARVPDFSPELPRDITVNGSGTFAVGGPEGDNGLSGKKLLLDHYGPRAAIGGTAMSGKDFRKADRAGTQLAQRLAPAVVRSGAAAQVTVQLVSFPDDEAPRYVRIATPERELAEAGRWLALVDCRFAVATPWCRSADLTDGARWGWFAREAPWEALALR